MGGLFTPKMAEDALQAGAGDLAAIGRNFLIEPAWPEKARRGEPIQTCYDCKTCQWFTDASRCPAVRKKILQTHENTPVEKRSVWVVFYYNGKRGQGTKRRKRIEYTDLKRKVGIGMNRNRFC
ncbi:MAG: hypothetical protein ACLRXC_13070 [[Clostridium] leptum]